jgi:multidrug resistance efflux pump
MAMLTKKSILQLLAATVAVIVFSALACAYLTAARQPSPDAAPVDPPTSETNDFDSSTLHVNVIRPRHDPSFTMTVSEPAYVEAYYKSTLKAKVSGPVKFVHKDIGARVKKDEILAEIDVPDLVQALAQAEQVIKQRDREEDLARAKVKVAESAGAAAQSSLQMKKSLLKAADAKQLFRYKRWKHLEALAKKQAVSELLVEEEEENYLSAYADFEAARDAIDQAKARLSEALQSLEVVKTDVAYKHSLVVVAEKDRDKAKALADYTKIVAPYDGVIVTRNVDPGSFVDVGTANSDPLFVVERTDIVTVYMKVPDTFAPYVSEGTEAVISMNNLSGVEIHGKVTRHNESLETGHTDLTMRVEVDLWNESKQEYQKWLASEEAKKAPAAPFDDLITGPKPWLPWIEVNNPNAPSTHLLPGYYGTMTLVLRNFRSAYLLPSDAIIQQGGESYIYLLKNGKAQKVQVDEQANDGKLAKVAMIVKKGKQVLREELTGQEQVIYSSLGDLSNGLVVEPVLVTW